VTQQRTIASLVALGCLGIAVTAQAAAPEGAGADYRTFFGLNPRAVVWFVAELHLMFAAFVLGVPIFAVLIEYVGARSGNQRFDRLAHECTRLLSAAFSTTAALGGLLAFALFGLYPKVMQHLAGAMHNTFYIYALCFFGEAFALYLYYYSWDRMASRSPVRPRLARLMLGPTAILALLVLPATFYLFFFNSEPALSSAPTPAAQTVTAKKEGSASSQAAAPSEQETQASRAAASEETLATAKPKPAHPAYRAYAVLASLFLVLYGLYAYAAGRKTLHLFLGIVLNGFGVVLMVIANSWASYMMSPVGVDPTSLEFVGSTWQAVSNPLWRPLSLHRLLGNVAFGGFVVGAYAAVKFLRSRSEEDRAHYDWMGYVGNFVGLAGLLLLPFAGYYLGREVYSVSPIMGNDMMGGFFSWTFILQALLIGTLFVGANYYLWAGMDRIEGAERYRPYVKYILGGLVIAFLVWVTPHNLPVAPDEQSLMGGQYHPVLKYLGLMPAKNAAVNFLLLSTFFSFMLYRRANKGELVPFSRQSGNGRIVLPVACLLTLALVGSYAANLFLLDPKELALEPSRRVYFQFHASMLVVQMVFQVLAVVLTFKDRGKLGQALLGAVTAILVAGVFGVSGFVVLEKANPFLRHLAVCQVLLVLSCMGLATAIDLVLFKGAREVGQIIWGRIGTRPQYALLLLCIAIVLTMGLMGYVRSGLRQEWHIYGVLQDTSAWAASPSIREMAVMVGAITLAFFALVSFVFWLGTLSHQAEATAADPPEGAK
jgi:cytochrome bd-type quinol oxidase subunit 1